MADVKMRQSNFEMYRIICIVLIIFMHSCGEVGSVHPSLNSFINTIGNIGVTGFILLSGYFGIRFKIAKLIKLDILMIFGSFLELLIRYVFYGDAISATRIVKCCIPFISHRYWFLSAYFALCILSPFINEYLEKIGQEQHKKLIIASGFLYLLMPTIFLFDQTGDGGKGIVNMILAYVIGRYVGIYYREMQISLKKLVGCLVVVVLINFSLNCIMSIVLDIKGNYFARDNSLLIMIQALLLLMIMARLRWNSKIVNGIASKVVAVYVLEDAMRMMIVALVPKEYDLILQMGWALAYALVVGVGIIVGALLLETIRNLLFDKLENKLIRVGEEWVSSWKK